GDAERMHRAQRATRLHRCRRRADSILPRQAITIDYCDHTTPRWRHGSQRSRCQQDLRPALQDRTCQGSRPRAGRSFAPQLTGGTAHRPRHRACPPPCRARHNRIRVTAVVLTFRSNGDRPCSTEREGFEPSNGVNPRYAISSRAHSTALAPLLGLRCASGPLKATTRGARRSTATTRESPPLVGFGAMLLASAAVSKDIGLLATFLGIGLIVNVIVVFIVVLVRGEHQQNQDRR